MVHVKTISIYLLIIAATLFKCSQKSAHDGHLMTMSLGDSVADKQLLDVTASVNRFVISNQKTVKPIYSKDQGIIHADGYVTEDIRRDLKVSSRIPGRIEKLFIRYNYQYVKRDERIMEIYSPDLNTYLEEYLFLKRKGDSLMVKTAKQKLLLLGIRESQLARLQKLDSVGLTIEVLSPSEGYIIFSDSPAGAQSSSTQPSDEMGSMASPKKTSSYSAEGRIREGAYVNAGETLFKVNDFKEVWAILSFRPNDQTTINQGLSVALHSELLPQDTIHGIINFIEPLYGTDQRFLQARVYLKNPRLDIKPNSILTSDITSSKISKLLLPQSSILHLGKQNVVWVKTSAIRQGNSVFEARLVSLGAASDGFVEIISGIDTKDEVATDAGYLMDSQSMVILK